MIRIFSMSRMVLSAAFLFALCGFGGRHAQAEGHSHEAFRKAFDACVASGIARPAPGQPTAEMEACMAKAGFTRPPGPPPQQNGERPEQSDSGSNNQ